MFDLLKNKNREKLKAMGYTSGYMSQKKPTDKEKKAARKRAIMKKLKNRGYKSE